MPEIPCELKAADTGEASKFVELHRAIRRFVKEAPGLLETPILRLTRSSFRTADPVGRYAHMFEAQSEIANQVANKGRWTMSSFGRPPLERTRDLVQMPTERKGFHRQQQRTARRKILPRVGRRCKKAEADRQAVVLRAYAYFIFKVGRDDEHLSGAEYEPLPLEPVILGASKNIFDRYPGRRRSVTAAPAKPRMNEPGLSRVPRRQPAGEIEHLLERHSHYENLDPDSNNEKR